ncbi:methyltransferase domain-containing protein, partial [Candidatus Woesearchaeota archaeon]
MSHYYSKKQDSRFDLIKINDTIRGFEIELTSSSGVFSKNKIDLGSKILAENMVVKKNDRVLDLGCGIGIIGIIASKLTENEVILTDINERACYLSKLNTKGIKNIKVKNGDLYETVKNQKFDVILLNPPQTAGKDVCFSMIEQAKNHLVKGGSLQLVARHQKGGKA